MRFAVPTQVGKHLCSTLDAEAAYFDKKQFVVERNAEGGWLLSPNLGAKNETMLNGRAVKDSVLLKDGDVLGVGRESKSIVKLPMVVHFE